MRDRRFRNLLILVASLALVARLAVILPRIGGPVDDPDHYVDLARSLMRSHQFAFTTKPTAYRPPLYPLLLAPLVGKGDKAIVGPLLATTTTMTWPIALFHLALGAATAVLSAIAARRYCLTDFRVLIAAGIVACDPLLVMQSRAIMTETLAAFLVAWSIAAAARNGKGSLVETGFALGLAALCRPSTLACSALVIAFLLKTATGSWRIRIRHATCLFTVIVATLTPWAVRNSFVFGEAVWTTTHGGYTLALANNADYYRDVLNGPPGAVWDETKQRSWALEIRRSTDGLSEPEADRRLAAQGWRMLRDRPRDFVRASFARIGRFWAVAPSPAVYGRWTRVASATWNVPLFALALLGLARRRSWTWPRAIIPAFLIGLSCVHVFYWTDMRMRTPLVPALALGAAMAVSRAKKTSEENSESRAGCVVGLEEIG